MGAKDIIEKAIKEAREKKPGMIISRDDIYNAIFTAGRKDVVEWIKSISRNGKGYGNIKVYPSEWQAKLKEWGIDSGH